MNVGSYGFPFGPPAVVGTGFGFPLTPFLFTTAATPTMVANKAYYQVNIGPSVVVTRIGIWILTSSGNIDVGIYTRSGYHGGSVPGVRKVSSGTTACPSAGYAEITIPATLFETGDYFAMSGDNGTYKPATGNPGSNTNDIYRGVAYSQTTAFPLPSVAGTGLTAAVNLDLLPLMKGLA
jgi:hypothetical protein